ncbi:sensor histidine kinase [Demequina sp. NBRC 110051]|uniref:sensor histidine kinase n=1 Tax=Demequina sp. NBRC 110051 TaxID=1570340 RepID=UPI0013563C97|nr:sensor histidine kinase [Demequina sp. NBRC 110051]
MRALGHYFANTWSVRTWREVSYLLIGLPLGILWFTYAVTLYAVGLALVIVWVGVVVLAFMQWTLRPLGALERRLANAALDAEVGEPGPRGYRLHEPGEPMTMAGAGRWGHALLHDTNGWRILAWIMMRSVLGPVGFALAVAAIVVPVSLVAAWLIAVGYAVGIVPGPGADEPTAVAIVDTVVFWTLVGTPVVAFAVPMFSWISHHYSCLHQPLARWALGPCAAETVARATARAELAETQVRIDQELHDSIGHMITMNIVQAGAGAHVFDSDPEFARQALRNIEERGRAAMGELDRIIAALRGDDSEPRAPLPGMPQLPALVAAARAAGLTVEADLRMDDAPKPVSRTVYAVIREAITNAAKHAPGAVIAVRVERVADAVGLQVSNGPGTAVPGRGGMGRGLAGIRDRAALLGGVSHTGRTHDGGFEVLALLPLEVSLTATEYCAPWGAMREKVSA